jgi:hypothetical protein
MHTISRGSRSALKITELSRRACVLRQCCSARTIDSSASRPVQAWPALDHLGNLENYCASLLGHRQVVRLFNCEKLAYLSIIKLYFPACRGQHDDHAEEPSKKDPPKGAFRTVKSYQGFRDLVSPIGMFVLSLRWPLRVATWRG